MNNFSRKIYWISPDGERFSIQSDWLHEDWAEFYTIKNKINVPHNISYTTFLLKRKWTRQSDCTFEVWEINKQTAWNIFEFANKENCRTILIEESILRLKNISSGIAYIELTPKNFIEQYG